MVLEEDYLPLEIREVMEEDFLIALVETKKSSNIFNCDKNKKIKPRRRKSFLAFDLFWMFSAIIFALDLSFHCATTS